MAVPDTASSENIDADQSPVTTWVRLLEAGDADAAQSIWEHFCTRVLALARQRVPASVRVGYDEEDVALSAFHSLFTGISNRRFDLKDRDDLWRLLITIAERKILNRVRHEFRDKRDVRRSVLQSDGSLSDNAMTLASNLDRLVMTKPTPAFAAEIAESCERLLNKLPEESLKRVALMKLENYTAEEIAKTLGCTRKTVQRKLFIIRRTWHEDVDSN